MSDFWNTPIKLPFCLHKWRRFSRRHKVLSNVMWYRMERKSFVDIDFRECDKCGKQQIKKKLKHGRRKWVNSNVREGQELKVKQLG